MANNRLETADAFAMRVSDERRTQSATRRMDILWTFGGILHQPRLVQAIAAKLRRVQINEPSPLETADIVPGRVVVVQTPSGYVPEVDPRTRTVTGSPKQFRMVNDGRIIPLPRSEWVEDPTVIVSKRNISYH